MCFHEERMQTGLCSTNMLTFRSKSIGQGVKPKLVQVAVFSIGLVCTALALKMEKKMEISVDGQPSPSSDTFELIVGQHDVTCATVGLFLNSTTLDIRLHVQLADNEAVGDKALMSIKSGDNLTYSPNRATQNFRLNVTMLTRGIVCSEGSATVRPIRVNIKPYSCNTSSVTINVFTVPDVTASKTIHVTAGSVPTVLCQSFVHCTQVVLASVSHPLHFQVEVGGQARKAKTVIALENYQDHAASGIFKTSVYLVRQGFNIPLEEADDRKTLRCKDVISLKTSNALTLSVEARHSANKRQAGHRDDHAETRGNKTTISRSTGASRNKWVVVGSGIGGASGLILLARMVFCCYSRASAADPEVKTSNPKTPGPAAAAAAAPVATAAAAPAVAAAAVVVVVVVAEDGGVGGGAPEPFGPSSAAPPAPATTPANPDAAEDAAIRESQGAEAEVGVTDATLGAVE